MANTGIPETQAEGAVAKGYAAIRRLLDVPFVPTVYRRMALEEPVFISAVDLLPSIVDLADATDFRVRVQRTARHRLPRPSHASPLSAHSVLPPDGQLMLQQYAAANPINLLFTTSLVGIENDPISGVMGPPWPRRDADLGVDIAACHGSDFVPGLWRDLRQWHDVYEAGWWQLRQVAQSGVLTDARDAVTNLTKKSLLGTTVERDAAVLSAQMSKDLARTLSWFPTGNALMIVEVEWLRTEFAGGS